MLILPHAKMPARPAQTTLLNEGIAVREKYLNNVGEAFVSLIVVHFEAFIIRRQRRQIFVAMVGWFHTADTFETSYRPSFPS